MSLKYCLADIQTEQDHTDRKNYEYIYMDTSKQKSSENPFSKFKISKFSAAEFQERKDI